MKANEVFNKHCEKSTFYAIKEQKGITLITLIVTIIVLLILAGITVANITGGDSTIDKASAAKQKTDIKNAQEEVEVEAAKLQMHDGEYIVNALQNKYSTDNKRGSATINVEVARNGANLEGALIKISTSDYRIIGTMYGSNGEIIWEEDVITNIDGVPIPNGFVASEATGENTVEGGLVIYEGTTPVTNYNVEVARRTRNQFVWVPVSAANLTYGADHTYDSKHSGGYTGYTWKDDGANAASVAKYGGFYIGRYEAGWNATVVDDTTYSSSKNDDTKLPVMKQGYAPWDYISQTKAKTVSRNLYNNSEHTDITSQLIDSNAWDTTVNWLKQAGIVTEITSGSNVGKINSVTYGNYIDSTFPVTNVLFAPHRYYTTLTEAGTEANKASASWSVALKYKVGSFNNVAYSQNELSSSDNQYWSREFIKPSLALGATDVTKTKNIYDLAGNLWEWTTEVGDHGTSNAISANGSFAVLRGGCFVSYGSNNPVVYRNGNGGAGSTSFNVGFRVVLYVNV